MSSRAVTIVVQLAALFFSISFHESAHAWVALKFGDTTARDLGRISLNPLRHIDPFGTVLLPLLGLFLGGGIFGYAKPTPVNLRNTRRPRLANFWVSLAGPGSNAIAVAGSVLLLLGIARISPSTVLAVFQGGTEPGILAPVAFVLLQLIVINLILGLFNLIPIPPLDGSGILFSLLGRQGMALEFFFHRNAMLMFILIFVLMYAGFFGMILTPVLRFVLGILERGIS
jgi:Zn-dependent protease